MHADLRATQSEDTTSLFCQMIAQLSELTQSATPTTFHKLLRTLDERNKLLRVYTQNIDALESKSGLTFGVPEIESKRVKPRSAKGKIEGASEGLLPPAEPHSQSQPSPPASRLPSPPIETPRCIPLHGTLQLMHCQICTHSFPLRDHLEDLASGRPPYCPECTALEATRQLIGKRSRGVGKLRPSVVLYNEVHKDGEEVGEAVRKDLVGSSKGKGRAGADLLLVVGTSLRVPGTKRIVREFAKAVRHPSTSQANASISSSISSSSSSSTTGLATPMPSPRRTPSRDEDTPMKVVYLNLDFPVPTREWEGVFDVWIKGDAQEFARMVEEEMEKEARAKEAANERKKKRLEAALAAALEEQQQEGQVTNQKQKEKDTKGKESGKGKKRKAILESDSHSTKPPKKRKVNPYLTPESTAKVTVPKKKVVAAKNDVLPTFPRHKEEVKQKLFIRIPPPSRRLIPEVVLPPMRAKEHQKQIKAPKASTSSPTTPSSPLTPITSPPPPHLRKTSISMDRRSPEYKFRYASHTQQLHTNLDLNLDPLTFDNYDAPINCWDSEDEMSDLTDLDSSGHGRLPESYMRTAVKYGVHDTGG